MVKTVKACLRKTFGKAFVPFEELQTILCEIEMVVNNRPLAYISKDDLNDALTPFHLMCGLSISTGKQFNSADCVSISCSESCMQRLFHIRKVLKDFWKRFRASYWKNFTKLTYTQRSKVITPFYYL